MSFDKSYLGICVIWFPAEEMQFLWDRPQEIIPSDDLGQYIKTAAACMTKYVG